MLKFWQTKNILSTILLPFSWIYRWAHFIHYQSQIPKSVDAKVICVGNITVGGAGKTPIAIAIAERYLKQKKKVAFISRGYKGSQSCAKRAVRVEPKIHTFKEVGDEPLLLAEIAPTYICPNRYLAAKMAEQDGAEVIIMDDGLQNNTLQKDHSILVVNSNYGFGNGLTLPAGPLREPLYSALERVEEIYVVGDKMEIDTHKKVTYCKVEVEDKQKFKNKKFVVLCGIANPEKFLNTLESLNVEIADKFCFPDHHSFTDTELEYVISKANLHKCKIVTTAKDFVRSPEKYQKDFEVLKIKIKQL